MYEDFEEDTIEYGSDGYLEYMSDLANKVDLLAAQVLDEFDLPLGTDLFKALAEGVIWETELVQEWIWEVAWLDELTKAQKDD